MMKYIFDTSKPPEISIIRGRKGQKGLITLSHNVSYQYDKKILSHQ